MSIWDDAQTSLAGSHRYSDGISWTITTQGIPLGDTPTDNAAVALAAAVFGWLGDEIRIAALTTSVPVELLAAAVLTETVEELGLGDASLNYREELAGYETDNTTPSLVLAGCCGLRLSDARHIAGNVPFTTANLMTSPSLSLNCAAQLMAEAFPLTRLQPPTVASAFNERGGPMLDLNSMWRMASYDGDPNRITRYVQWFNASMLACNADATCYRDAASFSYAMARQPPSPSPGPPSEPATQWRKPESQAAIDAGMLVASDGHPSLVGIWALDDLTLSQIKGVANDFGSGAGLPLGYPVFAYPDRSGTNHIMTGADVQALYRAMRDFIAQVSMYDVGRAPSLPGQPVNAG
jgi:hypothetical protein